MSKIKSVDKITDMVKVEDYIEDLYSDHSKEKVKKNMEQIDIILESKKD